jgi:hypothetical protein
MKGIRVGVLLAVVVTASVAWQAVSAAVDPSTAAGPDVLAAGTRGSRGARAGAAEGTIARVWVEPDDQQVEAGETFTVTLMVEWAVDLAGYEFDLMYDPSSLEGLDAEDAGFLGSSGREVTELGPQIDNDEGSLSFAAFSTSTTEPGVDGTGPLAVITMQASTAVETSAVTPRNVDLFDSEGQPYGYVVIDLWRVFLPVLLRSY